MTRTTVAKHAARVRKPNRRPGSVYVLTFKRAAVVFLAAFFLGAVVPQLAAPVAHAATVSATPAQEEAACAAVMHFHHANAAGWMDGTYREQREWNVAWLHAWHAANYADPQMRADIHKYLFTDTRWMAAYVDCGYGQ